MRAHPALKRMGSVMMWAGAAMIIGSAIAFAALNHGDRPQGGEFFYWQRYFVDNVVAIATRPGIWLFLFGTALLSFCRQTKRQLVLLVLSVLIVVNSQFFIIPLSHEASTMAFAHGKQELASEAFMEKKRLEDSLGAVNGLLLLTYLVIAVSRRGSPPETMSR